jgi:hypothetical protein
LKSKNAGETRRNHELESIITEKESVINAKVSSLNNMSLELKQQNLEILQHKKSENMGIVKLNEVNNELTILKQKLETTQQSLGKKEGKMLNS